MTSYRYPIVGMFYRPPAQGFVDILFDGAKLHLVAEPDNQFDPNAIQVLLPVETIKQIDAAAADPILIGWGTSIAEASQRSDPIHLGYIPKQFAKALKSSWFDNNLTIEASFSISSDGGPRVNFDSV